MNIVEKGKLPSIDEITYQRNDLGKYSFRIKWYNEYQTGFIFDSYKEISRNLVRVSRKDENGNEKYGVISTWGTRFLLPCLFDKIKPYNDEYQRGFIGDKVYFIDNHAEVYSKEIMDILSEYE